MMLKRLGAIRADHPAALSALGSRLSSIHEQGIMARAALIEQQHINRQDA